MFAWSRFSVARCFGNKALSVCYGRHNNCFTGANSSPSIDVIKKQFMQFEGGSVTLSKDETTGIAMICLDNLEKQNAFSGKMMVDFNDVVSELQSWTTGKGVILKSVSDGVFCSGGDLSLVKNILNSSMGARMSKLMQETTSNLLQLPLISVAVIEGAAIGGGAELTTACDFRLMGSSGSIQFVQGKMGVATGWGGGTRLVKLLGRRRALELLLRCRKIKADEGVKIGLVDEHINGGADQAMEWLIKMTKNVSPKVLCTIKGIVMTADKEPLESSLAEERQLFSNIWGGEDQVKALNENMKHR